MILYYIKLESNNRISVVKGEASFYKGHHNSYDEAKDRFGDFERYTPDHWSVHFKNVGSISFNDNELWEINTRRNYFRNEIDLIISDDLKGYEAFRDFLDKHLSLNNKSRDIIVTKVFNGKATIEYHSEYKTDNLFSSNGKDLHNLLDFLDKECRNSKKNVKVGDIIKADKTELVGMSGSLPRRQTFERYFEVRKVVDDNEENFHVLASELHRFNPNQYSILE